MLYKQFKVIFLIRKKMDENIYLSCSDELRRGGCLSDTDHQPNGPTNGRLEYISFISDQYPINWYKFQVATLPHSLGM